jgi:hypothetical protein
MLDQAGAGTVLRVGMQVCTMAGRCKGRAACGSWKGATAGVGALAGKRREDELSLLRGAALWELASETRSNLV